MIPALVEALADENGKVRSAASQALTRISPETVAALALRKEQALVGDQPPWMQRILRDSSYYAIAAKAEISVRGEAEVLAPLIKLLDHEEAEIRCRVARTFGNLKLSAVDAAPGLIALLSDENYRVRQASGRALTSLGPKVIPSLLRATSSENRTVRFWAVDALGGIGPAAKDAVPQLIHLFQNEEHRDLMPLRIPIGNANETDVGGRVLVALSEIGPSAKESLPFLKQVFEIQQFQNRAGRSLASFGTDALPFLEKKLDSDELSTHVNALDALLTTKGSESQVHKALGNSEAKVRRIAAHRLGWRQEDSRPALPYLVPLLQDPVVEVRRTALSAIARIGAARYDTIADGVLACADSENDQMRLDVQHVLRSAARDDTTNERLIQILLEAYSDGDARTRKAVLVFFDAASFDRIDPILTRYAGGQREAVSDAAKQILARKQKAKRQSEIRRAYSGPLHFYSVISSNGSQPFSVIGGLWALRYKLESRLLEELRESLR